MFSIQLSAVRYSSLFLLFQVAELKQELKMRGLTVSGTKNDLIERLRNYQEQNGNTAAAFKNAAPQSVQQASASAATTNTTASVSNTTPTFDHQLADGACFKLALSSLAQAVPGRVMRFGSTSSSPPVSPTPSERSLAGLSPDETSCNGDMFGEMVRLGLSVGIRLLDYRDAGKCDLRRGLKISSCLSNYI